MSSTNIHQTRSARSEFGANGDEATRRLTRSGKAVTITSDHQRGLAEGLGRLRDRCRAKLSSLDVEPDVVVWCADARSVTSDVPSSILAGGWLEDGDRRAALRRATGATRDALIIRRLLRRVVAAAVLDVAVDEARVDARCPTCGGADHGRPQIGAGAMMSTSARGRYVVIATARQPVGVDVERSDAAELRDPGPVVRPEGWQEVSEVLSRHAVGPVSHAAVWTALESLTKGLGAGLLARESDVAAALASWSLTPVVLTPSMAGHVAVAMQHPTVAVIDVSSEFERLAEA